MIYTTSWSLNVNVFCGQSIPEERVYSEKCNFAWWAVWTIFMKWTIVFTFDSGSITVPCTVNILLELSICFCSTLRIFYFDKLLINWESYKKFISYQITNFVNPDLNRNFGYIWRVSNHSQPDIQFRDPFWTPLISLKLKIPWKWYLQISLFCFTSVHD